jgi:hypothetical protein
MAVTISGSAGVTTNSGAVYNGLQTVGPLTPSGTTYTISGIPSWAKRITVMYSGVSTNGTANYWLRIGSGSVATTGYVSNAGGATNTGVLGTTTGTITTAFMLTCQQGSGALYSGIITLTNINGNTWVCSGTLMRGSGSAANYFAGTCTLGSSLNIVALTTLNGTDSYNAGTVNIIYE